MASHGAVMRERSSGSNGDVLGRAFADLLASIGSALRGLELVVAEIDQEERRRRQDDDDLIVSTIGHDNK